MANSQNIARLSPLDQETPLILANGIEIQDRTLFPRIGVKGPGLPTFIENTGLTCGIAVNRAYRQEDGSLTIRLAPSEIIWLANDPNVAPDWTVTQTGLIAPDTYIVPRMFGNFWFTVKGEAAIDGFSRLCGVDLRPKSFSNADVAQTLLAKTGAIIIRDDAPDKLAFHILGDMSLAPYIWDCIKTAFSKA